MRTYRVEVREEGFAGSFCFTGVPASNSDEACEQGIESYMLFCDEMPNPLVATAELEAA